MATSDFAFDALAAEYDRQFTNSRIGTYDAAGHLAAA